MNKNNHTKNLTRLVYTNRSKNADSYKCLPAPFTRSIYFDRVKLYDFDWFIKTLVSDIPIGNYFVEMTVIFSNKHIEYAEDYFWEYFEIKDFFDLWKYAKINLQDIIKAKEIKKTKEINWALCAAQNISIKKIELKFTDNDDMGYIGDELSDYWDLTEDELDDYYA